MRQQFAEPDSAFAVLFERKERRRHWKVGLAGCHSGEALTIPNGSRQLLTAKVRQLWLVIKQLHLRGSSRLKQVDDLLRLWRKVRQAGSAWEGRVTLFIGD